MIAFSPSFCIYPIEIYVSLRKDLLKKILKAKNDLSHMYHFKELPDEEGALTVKSYNSQMLKCGELANKVDEDLAGVKGTLDKRAKRAKLQKEG